MRAAGRHTAPPVILKRVRRPPPDPDSTLQARQPPSAMRPAHLADPAIAAHPSYRPSSIQAQPLPHGAGGPHAKQTVVSRPRRPSTAKRGRGDSRQGSQPAGVAEGRGAIGRARSRIRQGCGWQGPQPESRRVTGHSRKGPQLAGGGCNRKCPQPYPAGTRRESDGVFSRALYHLQA